MKQNKTLEILKKFLRTLYISTKSLYMTKIYWKKIVKKGKNLVFFTNYFFFYLTNCSL